MTAPEAMFLPDGDAFVPTRAAVGPWHEHGLHGGVVGALLTGLLERDGRSLARISIELVAPAWFSPLRVTLGESVGGKRVQRQEASVECDGKTVAIARAVTIRHANVGLPAVALEDASPFDPAAAPPMSQPNPNAASMMGWDGFASLGCANVYVPRADGDLSQKSWTSVLVPVVAGAPTSGYQRAVIAADTAQTGVARRIPFEQWTFVNAELTAHFARQPVGSWVAIDADGILASNGCGIGVSQLFDADGRFGQSATALVLESRTSAL